MGSGRPEPVKRPYQIKIDTEAGSDEIDFVEEYVFGWKYFYIRTSSQALAFPRDGITAISKRPMGTQYWAPIPMRKRTEPKIG